MTTLTSYYGGTTTHLGTIQHFVLFGIGILIKLVFWTNKSLHDDFLKMKLFSFVKPFLVNVINVDETFAELVNSMSGIYDLQGNCK